MSANLPNTIPGIRGDAVSEPLFPVPDSDDPLTVPIPCYIIDPAGDDVVLAFRILRTNAIPYSYGAAYVAGSNVEA